MKPLFVKKDKYKGKWPFTVSWGHLFSVNKVAIFRHQEEHFQLNGVSNSTSLQLSKLTPESIIWLDDPSFAGIEGMDGIKVNIGPFLKLALKHEVEEAEVCSK